MDAEWTTLLNGRVGLYQQPNGLRASTDTVLVAAAVTARAGQSLLDMGCGAGGVGLCVLERLKAMDLLLTGVDIQPDLIKLAQKNGPEARFIHGDVTDKSLFGAEAFDHIVMNPPYFETGKKHANPDHMRDIAFNTADFIPWLQNALHWVRQGGSVTLIHKPDAMTDIIAFAKGKFGNIEIRPVYSKPDKPAIRIVMRMVRNRKSPLMLHPPLYLYDANGRPTAECDAVLRDGRALIP